MTLAEHLARRIRAEGPLSVAEVMADALMHPRLGYYATRDPFGADGDFTTAPEISQMFGELVGLWCAVVWQQMGAPARLPLIELGPGRGTLMADALRAARLVPGFRDAVELHLVEASPTLRAVQARAVTDATWHDDTGSLPDGPAVAIANEFFDALPVLQLVRRGGRWRERRVALDAAGRLAWTETPGPSAHAALLAEEVADAGADGDVAELCPAGLSIADGLARRVAACGGAVLVIDYGHPASAVGDTLQAVRRHRPVDPLASLGVADLTAHVDFGALARAAGQAGAEVHGPVTQATFLGRLGIETRATRLMQAASPAVAADVQAALRRLIDPGEMGTLFKAMAWTSSGAAVPPGFEGPSSGTGVP